MKYETWQRFKNELIFISKRVIAKSKNVYIDLNRIESIYEEYTNIRNGVHKLVSSDDYKIDRHKIASCFLFAILFSEPIQISNKESILSYLEKSANIQLGVNFGLYILSVFTKADAKNNIDKWIADKDIELPTDNYKIELYKLIFNNRE